MRRDDFNVNLLNGYRNNSYIRGEQCGKFFIIINLSSLNLSLKLNEEYTSSHEITQELSCKMSLAVVRSSLGRFLIYINYIQFSGLYYII